MQRRSARSPAPVSYVPLALRADYRPHYTDALAETVGAFYAADVARFGYRF